MLDRTGVEIPVRLLSRDVGSASFSESILGDVPPEVKPSLPPGRYSVEFSFDGFAPRSVDIDLVAGQTMPVDVVLQSEK